MTRIRACSAADVAEGEGLRIELDPPIAVFNAGGEYFATQDWCSHEQLSLAEGWVQDCQIECPWHGARFCLKTGEALAAPASEPIRTYRVIVEDGDVFVELEDAAA